MVDERCFLAVKHNQILAICGEIPMRGKLLRLILVVGLASALPGKTLAQAPPVPGEDQSLNVDDQKDKARTGSVCKTYTYKMIEGRSYQIDMKSKEIDSYLRLENPEGVQVAFDDDSGGFPDARIIYRAPKTGDYTIICTTYATGSTGKFTLVVKDSDIARAAPSQPKELSGELTANDPKDKVRNASFAKFYPYKLEKGRTYQIDLRSKDFDSYLRLENPAGAQVAFDDDSGGYRDARIIYQPQESGEFKIIATTFIGGAGRFTLTVKEASPAGVAAPEANQAIAANSTWAGTENLAGFGGLTFVFRENGRATMTDASTTGNGSWSQTGRSVTIRFKNCVYSGEINGAVLQGTAQYTEGAPQTWSFRVEKK
jgi:hypothetical protein